MTLDTEDEILNDFLIEASEILDALGEQLVQLERTPDDKDLLNSVFRSFHTIKGGAGFLNLENLVKICHRAEDVFNLLRQGQRRADSNLMDIILQVLDVLNRMFDELRSGQEPEPAPDHLLAALEPLTYPEGEEPAHLSPPPAAAPAEPAEPTPAPSTPMPPVETADGDITDEEFEALLDAMQEGKDNKQPGNGAGTSPVASPAEATQQGGDEITDAEFEQLLDELQGKGASAGGQSAAPAAASGQDELISEDEFENLLDQLHGKGQAPQPQKSTGGETVKEESRAASPPAAKPTSTGEAAPPEAPAPTQAKAAPAETSVRVDTKRLDDIMNLVGELVLVRNRLATLRSRMKDEQVSKAVTNLDVVTADLQAAVMKTRMQPIKKVFGRFPRVVRDLARTLKKEINLELEGEDTDLDKNLVEALADPLVHLVRNAVDHGIESPEERQAAGKARAGRVVLSANQEGDHILLTISDDGKGMDPDVLRGKAVEKGMMDEDAAARLTDHDAFNLIFRAGFSTKTEISDVSGRGVGMDVVKTRIAQLNGRVEITSAPGQGSTLSIRLPLTLAILPTLMVVLGKQRFALPLANVSEIFDLDLSRTNRVDDQEVIMVRNRSLPLYYLRRWLVSGDAPAGEGVGHVVVVFAGNQRVGFVVDSLIGQEEVVIKPLGNVLHGVPGLAGATITGDGGIALILDVPGLLKSYARRL
ncbi:chemotaxis protein CheA [Ectothiorhodospira variabilis]|uniref:chemotaxis protein CheA n=1 Tax=Ectothiorhodospira variabilis TaxID=505694 RepID=UPI001EFABEFE|nr:chemotaxis protein CheA [Ectothiorhodospira variabilis]MCG5494045.1 chemotaxis protein CheA [Ectothiorhodospira variabilis]MCG5503425.1 chemotaxis protein CheA [Ectothiorhodospira variabilis]MCG5506487.1 chemotaxis protein CheA [Ectothiorhodospira variabilis]